MRERGHSLCGDGRGGKELGEEETKREYKGRRERMLKGTQRTKGMETGDEGRRGRGVGGRG